MAKPSRIHYWDASVYIAWITDEQRDPVEVNGLDAVVEEIDKGQAVLVTSTITLCEVFAGELDESSRERFRGFLGRPRVPLVEVTAVIAQKAGELRQAARRDGRRLSTPDAVHLATAALLKVDEVHSFDPHHLNLDGRLPELTARICRPATRQGRLPL